MARSAKTYRDWYLRHTAAVVREGGVIAYPTEAVFGLGCDPLNYQAVSKLLSIKQRKPDKGLILIAADLAQIKPYIGKLSKSIYQKIEKKYSRPTTWLLPKADSLPYWLSGKHDKIAIRITAHPIAAELCRRCGYALVSTSANVEGQPPARNSLRVQRSLGSVIDKIVCGETSGLTNPSRIIDAQTNKIIRAN